MTLRTKLLSLAAVAALAVGGALAAHAQQASLTWQVEGGRDAGEVQLNLTHREGASTESHGRNLPLASLQGLDAAQLSAGAAQPVRFRLARDAGTFVCEGSAQRGMGAGVCDFEAGRAFARRLQAEGRGSASDEQLLSLAMSDVGGAYLDELKRQRYATASVDEIVGAAHHGVGLTYLQGMGAAGYRLSDLAALSRLRDHGVDPRYIAALKTAGYSGLSAEEITRLRDHGVSSDFISQMGELGYRKLSAEELVRLRDHGVSASFVSQLRELGYGDLTAAELARLRDHGVTASFIRRANADGPRLEADELIRLRDR